MLHSNVNMLKNEIVDDGSRVEIPDSFSGSSVCDVSASSPSGTRTRDSTQNTGHRDIKDHRAVGQSSKDSGSQTETCSAP